jgi:putative ABC transport system permease protein
MRRVTLRSVWAHKRRLLSTVLAVVLGVTFMTSTFIMSTTIDQSFDDLFSKVVDKVDALAQGPVLYSDLLNGDERANLDQSLVAEIAKAPGVEAAEGHVSTDGSLSFNRVLGAGDEPIGNGQASTILENWLGTGALSPYHLTHGAAPARDDEAVLNIAAAEDGHLAVGDRFKIVTQSGPRTYTLVGTFALGAAKSQGGAISVGFTLAEAQRVAGLEDQVNEVWIQGADGIDQQQLADGVATAIRGQAEVITGTEAAAQLSKDTQDGSSFKFLSLALTIFGAIALLVGIFVISNTFSILVAQRTKELALLRALGASRAQVLGSVLLEASLVGAAASVLGLLGGIGLSQGVTAGLRASGASLPNSRLVIEPDTIVIALAIGVAVTLLASLLPALRATRVPPLAALRDVAIDRSSLSRFRIGAGALALVVGAVNLSVAWRSAGDTSIILQVGIGGGLAVVGFLVIGPVLAGRTVRVLGSPLPRFRGVTGRLATENAARSPKRTSATASAVVVGVALVVFIQVFASSASKSVSTEVNRGFNADFVVNTKQTGLQIAGGIPSSVAGTVSAVPGVDVVSPLGFGSIGIQYPDGKTATHFVTAIDPKAIGQVLTPRMEHGRVEDLDDDGAFVDKYVAQDHDIHLGDRIVVIAPGGATKALQVQGIGDDRNLLGLVTLTRASYQSISPQLVDIQVAGKVKPGEDVDTVIRRVQHALDGLPSVQVLDREGFIGSIVDQISSYITLIRGLLLLSIITALFGIANTLSLSINERTRELGLLRAVGMDRTDVRSAVRWEALLISVLGALVGISMGIVLSIALVKALGGYGLSSFAFPGGGLAVIFVATTALGTAAAILPARRAVSLSILDAIVTE